MTVIPIHRRRDNGPWFFVRPCLLRVLVFGMIWWLLVDGDMNSWPIGAPAIAIAVIVSMITARQHATHWRLPGALKLLLYFLWKSIVGAIDVARRAFHPDLPLEPVLWEYRLRLPDGHGKVFLANIVSLLPGTLSAELKSDRLIVHVLDGARPHLHELAALEERIGHLYGQDLGKLETAE